MAWRDVFATSAAIYFISCVCYLAFISADVQPWNYPDFLRESLIEEKAVYFLSFSLSLCLSVSVSLTPLNSPSSPPSSASLSLPLPLPVPLLLSLAISVSVSVNCGQVSLSICLAFSIYRVLTMSISLSFGNISISVTISIYLAYTMSVSLSRSRSYTVFSRKKESLAMSPKEIPRWHAFARKEGRSRRRSDTCPFFGSRLWACKDSPLTWQV